MKSKKGLGFTAIITVVLGIVVIALLLAGPLRQTYEFAKEKFFGKKSVFPNTIEAEEAFVPYIGKEQATLDSVKALVCGINIVAGDATACSEGDKSEECYAKFGRSCVKCSLGYGIGISGGSLSFEDIVGFITECGRKAIVAGDDVFCGVMQLNGKLDKDISEKDLENWLEGNNAPIAGINIFHDKKARDFLLKNKSYYLCANYRLWPLPGVIYLYDDALLYPRDCYNKYFDTINKRWAASGGRGTLEEVSCTVSNFELDGEQFWIQHLQDSIAIRVQKESAKATLLSFKLAGGIDYLFSQVEWGVIVSPLFFYLSSPCKAELKITREPCSSLYTFNIRQDLKVKEDDCILVTAKKGEQWDESYCILQETAPKIKYPY